MRCGCAPIGWTKRRRTRVSGELRGDAAAPRSPARRGCARAGNGRARRASARARPPAARCRRARARGRDAARTARARRTPQRGSGSRPVARSSIASKSAPKRRAKPSRGRRRHSPTVRTPIVASVCSAFSRPARAGERQRRDAGSRVPRGCARARDASPACWRANHSDASGVGVIANRTVAPVVSAISLFEPVAQLPRAAEQAQAAAHLEQHAVRRLEAHAWREVQAATRHRLEQLSSRVADRVPGRAASARARAPS